MSDPVAELRLPNDEVQRAIIETTQNGLQDRGVTQGLPGGGNVAPLPLVGESDPVDDGQSRAQSGEDTLLPVVPRVKRKERWILLNDESYENFQFRAWVNYPQRLQLDMVSREPKRVLIALQATVLEHNGWLDEDGNPYPPPSDSAFWEGEKAIPNELLQAIITLLHLESGKLPNLLIERARNMSRT